MSKHALTLMIIIEFWGTFYCQNIGTFTEEYHLPITIETCNGWGCLPHNSSLVLDAGRRWLHAVDGQENCMHNGMWDETLCPDPKTCAENCALDGIDKESWSEKQGVLQWEDGFQVNFVTEGPSGRNVGTRVYVMASDDENYWMFKLKNREFSMTIDISGLGCGLNGAAYFIEMLEDGGLSEYEGNKAGSKYGLGYCDAQCPQGIKWVSGEANMESKYGSCCFEMDIWEANSQSTLYTIHNCKIDGYQICEGDSCDVCSSSGCGFNPYRHEVTDFYGSDSLFKVDTRYPFTFVTQFITEDGTDDTDLVEIRRKYIQNGNVFDNPPTAVDGFNPKYDSLTDDYCKDVFDVFGGHTSFAENGGMKSTGDALERGVALAFSLWADHSSHMLWLDGHFPVNAPAENPGVIRGPCGPDTGDPDDLIENEPDSFVRFYGIRIGDIDTTYSV